MSSAVEQLIDDYLSYADMAESLLVATFDAKTVWDVRKRHGSRNVIRKRSERAELARVRGLYSFHGAGLMIRVRHGRTIDIDSDKNGLKRGFDEHLIWSFIEDNKRKNEEPSAFSSFELLAGAVHRLRAERVIENRGNLYYVLNAARWRENHPRNAGGRSLNSPLESR